jgi:hypothetical protein
MMDMKSWAVGALLLSAACSARAQITSNPLPAPIVKRGLAVEVQDLVRLPETRNLRPADQDVTPTGWARVSFVRDTPDGRRFANDSRGFLYIINGGRTSLYADLAAVFPHAWYARLESGFIAFDFHPEFERNGLWYSVHLERAEGNPATPDFIPPGFDADDVTFHNVITEWKAADPRASTFTGTHRELLRIAHVVQFSSHPLGAVEFNPTARPGSPDYGLLYTSGSDLGFSNGGGPNASNPSATQRLDSLITAILRIDPRSPRETNGVKGLGDYTIPADNVFQADGDPKTLGEIYAYGFRNAHRLSWDLMDGAMYVGDIGMNHIEEINIVRNGGNYGWMRREGYFENGMIRPGGALNQLYELPGDVLRGRNRDEFTYPVAIYDHDEGVAITGVMPYHGRIDALRGKLLFGDVNRGRLFATDIAAAKAADDGVPETVAPIEEIQLYVRGPNGQRIYTSFRELVEGTMGTSLSRTDLHLGRTSDGEIFLTSRQDGMIRMLVPDSSRDR